MSLFTRYPYAEPAFFMQNLISYFLLLTFFGVAAVRNKVFLMFFRDFRRKNLRVRWKSFIFAAQKTEMVPWPSG